MNTVIRAPRLIAWFVAATLALPTVAMTAGCGHNSANDQAAPMTAPNGTENPTGPMTSSAPPAKPGLTTKQKVVLLAGAALLFYLYKRYKSQDAANASGMVNGHPQLYREDKGPNQGAIYYRKNDANHTVVWLQAPAQGVQVPADQVQQYLPNYSSNPGAYQGQVNTNPQAMNGQVQPATQYDPSLAGG